MPEKIGNIEVYMGPKEVGGPDDLRKTIVNFIDGAKKRLDIAVQELDSWEIADAILRARKRGVSVRLVLELDYLRSKKASETPKKPRGELEINRNIHNALLRSAIKVNSDFNTKIFHQKFIIRDGEAVLTGSTNFTDTGTSTNLNHLIIIRDKKVAKIYTREFREIQQGHFGRLNEGHDKAPDEVTVSNLPIRILFAPDHSPEMEIMKQMAKAKKQIDFAIFTFAQSSGIDDQMILMRTAGIPVRGVLDGKQANQKWAATRPVKNAGAMLRLVLSRGKLRKLHHKLMVIDKQVIIAGSFNYTGAANSLNDENIVVIGNLGSKKKPSIDAQKRLAGYAFKEIDRIYNKFGKKIR
jgi:phosphatidylserine/phosphatidylglycerophosphate/cardiolipin synthase-like enzyme